MIKAILTDIEGTTTSISFVKDVLFPHARAHIGHFVHSHRQSPEVDHLLAEVRQLAHLSDQAGDADLVACLIEWIDQDRKLTPLKALQGMIWEQGYAQGDFHGHLYPDVAARLKDWHQRGYRLGIYSSGSVRAQKLLFTHTEWGDLTPLFSDYFDTGVGAKQDVNAYREIIRLMGLAPDHLLFLSDMPAELNAAREAGLHTCRLVRQVDEHPDTKNHPIASDFDAVDRLILNKT